MAKLLKDAGFDPPEFILSSPLSRANQTARIMQEEFAPKASFETNEGLRPGTSLERLMSIIASKKDECEALMIVSHDPMISALASAILTGKDEIVIEMKKSSVVMLEISRFDVSRMRGALRAYLPPEII
jgi:phosphohistidine phosphatase